MYSTRVASARQVFFDRQTVSADKRTEREKSFFKSLSLPNGTHKTTAPGRLTDVDRIVHEHLGNVQSVRLLDVGISSGVTTLELLNHLEAHGCRVSGVGVDTCVHVFLKSFFGIDVLYDHAGNVLQVATPLFARGRPQPSQKSFQSKALGLGLDLLESPLLRKWLLNGRGSIPIALVVPDLLAHTDFHVVEHDVAVPMHAWDESFDLVRAANILNLDYFMPSQIATIVKNLLAWLKRDGLLVVCRTSETGGTNHGSLYQKQQSSLWPQHVCSFGGGWEFDPLLREMADSVPAGSLPTEPFHRSPGVRV